MNEAANSTEKSVVNAENRKKVLDRMNELDLPIRLYEHDAVFTMEQMTNADGVDLSEKGILVKNLFLREHKSDRFFLVVLDGDKTADIKSVRRYLGVKPLSFADEDSLIDVLGVTGGSVTPLAVLFDSAHKADIVIDDSFRTTEKLLGVHPADNTATLFMTYKELEKFVESCGHTLINMQI